MNDTNTALQIDLDDLHEHNKRYPGSKNIPIDTLIALRKKNLSFSQIAKIVGCNPSNITRRLSTLCKDIDSLETYKEHRADVLTYHQRKILERITDADVRKAGLLEKVKAASFLHNAERLERGQSTQNIAYADILRAKDRVDKELSELDSMSE